MSNRPEQWPAEDSPFPGEEPDDEDEDFDSDDEPEPEGFPGAD